MISVLNSMEMVYLKIRPYHMKSLARKSDQKLAPKCLGPFKVLAHIGEVVNRINLHNNCKVHPVFHVSKLLKDLGATG